MPRLLLALAAVVAACSSTPAAETTIPPAPIPAATTTPAAPTLQTTVASDLPCRPPPFGPTALPDRVADATPAPAAIEIDKWTALPGTSLAIWTDPAGAPVVALVRGALPPERWSDEPAEIEVRGSRAAVGPLSDGVWAVAWFEGPDRCDDYTLYVYPPTSEQEAQTVAESIG